MNVLKKVRGFAEVTWNKATEVANDINEKLEKRKQIRELLEDMADYEDEIFDYILSAKEEEFDKLPDVIKDNADAIKAVISEIEELQVDGLSDEEYYDPEDDCCSIRFCIQCGKEIGCKDKYCKHCGAQQ